MSTYLAIGDKVEVTAQYTSGHAYTWEGVLRGINKDYAFVQRGASTKYERVPRENVRGLEERTAKESAFLRDNPVEVYAPWEHSIWSTHRFPDIEAANRALARLYQSLPRSYVHSHNDPRITVGNRSRLGWEWA